MNDLPPMERTITPVTGNPVPQVQTNNSEGFSYFSIIKWSFIIVILAALGFNIFLYAYEGTDIVSKYFISGTESTIGTANKGAILGLKLLSKTLQAVSSVFTNQPTDETLEKPKKEKKKPEGNKSGDKIQKARKAGYCYIGTYGDKRHCIEVDESDKCLSGKVFSTLQKCSKVN